jgi:uncharacterized protein (UPF0548 family)
MIFASVFLIREPSTELINRFISEQGKLDLDASVRGLQPEPGYSVDHNRIELGRGEEVFEQASAAMRRWEMFNLGWLRLFWPDAAIEQGSAVAVLVEHLGFWSLNACKIILVIDTRDGARRFGFVYGTLPDHAERGWECFSVEWDQESDKVSYDILACSKPNKLLAKLGYPYARSLQKRFARDSMRAMLREVRR